MPTKIMIVAESDLATVITELKQRMNHCYVFAFEGPLGAGKTTIVRKLLGELGIHEKITSPTFSYVNIYENMQGQRFYHFDLYRINNLNDFLAAGFTEYLYQPNSWAFIEWPQPIVSLLKQHVCYITIDYADGLQKRKIIIDEKPIIKPS